MTSPNRLGEYRAKKRFGQNFLQDQQVIEQIVAAIAPKPHQPLLEIGPGLGALTQKVLSHSQKLWVVEKDRDVLPYLQAACDGLGELLIVEQDALKFSLSQLKLTDKVRVFGNLPYNISSPLLMHLMGQLDVINDMHFMLQKEVVDRISAAPGSKVYGRLSVAIQYFCEATTLLHVPPTAFDPPPKVDSAVFRLVPHQRRRLPVSKELAFLELVRQAFGQRRKTLRNNLKPLHLDWSKTSIDPGLRPERLSVEDYVELTLLSEAE